MGDEANEETLENTLATSVTIKRIETPMRIMMTRITANAMTSCWAIERVTAVAKGGLAAGYAGTASKAGSEGGGLFTMAVAIELGVLEQTEW
ncbi:hypothetical protein QYF36_021912 [Acer negundo]|nr:hypothetical protein QYF36_021912 [Acer negundo]